MSTFPTHRTKINRAMALAEIGENKATAEALLRAIPDRVIAKVTGHELAELLDAMWQLSCETRRITQAEVVRDGFVWDERDHVLRDLA
ncbi:hypothetical protein T8T21_18295 (plasmid) [Limimaricola variabilis]|uniref:hypothetical protein n=1 Tax=Limimaricola variabilis TaxID=1492771 RepID=UPI002AC93389|nr:hypothetical protein [Limimaricola variabilis]WPY96453.1 hypothetical protein T8T21_18295 [Limimaricola variabilis]